MATALLHCFSIGLWEPPVPLPGIKGSVFKARIPIPRHHCTSELGSLRLGLRHTHQEAPGEGAQVSVRASTSQEQRLPRGASCVKTTQHLHPRQDCLRVTDRSLTTGLHPHQLKLYAPDGSIRMLHHQLACQGLRDCAVGGVEMSSDEEFGK